MINNRPRELTDYIEKSSEQNDLKISAALEKLEAPENWLTLKPTVSTITRLTNLSRNTIRNRQWALDRLKLIKHKRKTASNDKSDASRQEDEEISLPVKLRTRIKSLLEQNVLLYQEVLSLQEIIRKKDLEIAALKLNRRL